MSGFAHLGPPVPAAELVPRERAALLALLHDLEPEDWDRATWAPGWSVHDVGLHLLGNELGRVSDERDGFDARRISGDGWDEFVAALNAHNEAWVEQARLRISPALLCELLAFTGERVATLFAGLDPLAAGGSVSWAGPGPAPVWLDIAREYTENWVHQQQIRTAVERPGLTERAFLHPVLDTFLRALPWTFADVPSPEGTVVEVALTGPAGGRWRLHRTAARWSLTEPTAAERAPAAVVTLDADTAWRLFCRALDPATARAAATICGERRLGERVLSTVSVIA